jgi:hypothetical protein
MRNNIRLLWSSGRCPGAPRDKGDGAQGRNRTTDTVIFSHVLYQLSYLGVGRERTRNEGERAVL